MNDLLRFLLSVVVLLVAGAFIAFAPSCLPAEDAGLPAVDHSQHHGG